MNEAWSGMNLSWEVELTTRCNSRCVGCSRQMDYVHPNPYFNSHVDLDPAVLLKALEQTQAPQFILFCGNYGDPLVHPKALEIFESLHAQHPDTKISVHTNGSFGSKDFWQRLAAYFQKPGFHINFSIDGLQSSHESFRRNTHWQNVIKNAEYFIAAGGRAIWKMIEFEHNRHEIEEARALSQRLGFRRFEVRANNYPGLDPFILMRDEDIAKTPVPSPEMLAPVHLQKWNEEQVSQKSFDKISCRSLERQNLFLDAHGAVWPCCWIGGLEYRPEHQLREWSKLQIHDRYGREFNSLKTQNLADILNHSWFREDLIASWGGNKPVRGHALLGTCAKTCGVSCKSSINKSE